MKILGLKEYFCLDCDYIWHDHHSSECPECSSKDIDNISTDDWVDGHYEGEMSNRAPQNDIGDE